MMSRRRQYESEPTERLSTLVSSCAGDCKKEIPVREIEEVLRNPNVDPNIPFFNLSDLDIPQGFIRQKDERIRARGRDSFLEILAILEIFGRRPDFDANKIYRNNGMALIHLILYLHRPGDRYAQPLLSAILKLHNIDVNLRSASPPSFTALQMAIYYGSVNMARILLVEGHADSTMMQWPNTDQSIIQYVVGPRYAVYKNIKLEMTRLLLEEGGGCDVNVIHPDSGDTLLHICQDPDVCELLIEKGCDFTVLNNAGRNAMQHAYFHNRGLAQEAIKDAIIHAENMCSATQHLFRSRLGPDVAHMIASRTYPPLFTPRYVQEAMDLPLEDQ